jgi:HK97 family phage major capsid protein
MDDDTLVYGGDAVKALDDTGRVGGYLVRYGSADDVDLTGDYFDSTTDFDVEQWPYKSRIYYQHGLDAKMGHRKLGSGEMRQDDIGVWVEAQLALRDDYEKAIFELVKQGKMGWSSGTAGHLVEREQKSATAAHIQHWPLGLDASITPTPAEYRNSAVSLKSLSATQPELEALLPETARPAVVQETKATEQDAPEIEPTQEETEMAEETNAGATVDVTALVESIVAKAFAPMQAWLDQQPVKAADIALPMMNTKTKLGDDETKAFAHYIRSGDAGGINSLKASNNNPMTEGTPAQGGFAVPVGMYNQIVGKLREDALYPKIGVRQIPGKGLTVNVPIEGAKDGAFVATTEGNTTDRDSPVLAQAAMTLIKYTKRIELSWELMEDEDAQLVNFLAIFVGQGMAKTHNTLLVTEAVTNGTLGVAWGNPIIAGNIPSLVYALPQGYEDNAVWVLNKSVEGLIRGFTGNYFQFIPTPADGPDALSRRELFGYPLYNSATMATSAASAKAALFGNFSYMGMRLAPDITFLRDPYSAANTGQLRLHYYFRTVYKVLQAEAILYSQMGT